MGVFSYVELGLGTALSSIKNHYHKTVSQSAFLTDSLARPNLEVTSPSYQSVPPESYTAPSGASFPIHKLNTEHSQYGTDIFPGLKWSCDPALLSQVKEWVIVIEDPDAPLWFPTLHAFWYKVPKDTMKVTHEDIQQAEGMTAEDWPKKLKGGFVAAKNIRSAVYAGGKPPYGHGRHLYFHQVIGVGRGVDWTNAEKGKKGLTLETLKQAVDGKVVCWGNWIGSIEHVWE